MGTIIEPSVGTFRKGDRVVSNGKHAEVSVGRFMCKGTDNVSNEMASFTVLSAIGLQGIRLANPTIAKQ